MGMVTMDHTYEVHQIKTYHQMWSNYCYIIADRSKKSAIAVDPSWEIDKITDKLHELDVDLSAILLTHSHYDHVNLAEPLQQIYHSDIYMSSAEIDFYQFRCRNLIALEDGQTFAAGGFIIRSILTPGHTAGECAICYLITFY
ncbi:MBL fold metallo-hydrolase [Bacillus velezensis]